MILSPHNPNAPQRCRAVARHGTTLIEMGAALALLGTVLALLVPVLSRTSGLRESVDRREVALNTVANLLERASLVASPTPETLQPMADQLEIGGIQFFLLDEHFLTDADLPEVVQQSGVAELAQLIAREAQVAVASMSAAIDGFCQADR